MSDRNRLPKLLKFIFLTLSISMLTSLAQALPGDLLDSFGLDGIVTTDFDTDEDDSDAQARGSVIVGTSLFVAGFSYNGINYDFIIAKYDTTTGALDNTFGSDGIVATAFNSYNEYVYAIASDGTSLFVAGNVYDGSNYYFAIAKYDATSGDLVTAFDDDGIVITDISENNTDVANAIVTDGTSLFVAGTAYNCRYNARMSPLNYYGRMSSP